MTQININSRKLLILFLTHGTYCITIAKTRFYNSSRLFSADVGWDGFGDSAASDHPSSSCENWKQIQFAQILKNKNLTRESSFASYEPNLSFALTNGDPTTAAYNRDPRFPRRLVRAGVPISYIWSSVYLVVSHAETRATH